MQPRRCEASSGFTLQRRAGTQALWAPDQQRTKPQERLAAQRPGHTRSQGQQATPSRSRRAFRASFVRSFRPLRSEGAGNAGRPMRPPPHVQWGWQGQERTHVSQVVPENTRHSPRNGLRLMACSPRRSLFPPSPVDLSTDLTPASGASGPHVFAVRLGRLRQRHPPRPPQPAPR
jgi:hypothetical protein